MSILIVGEAWGEKEAETGTPFVGASGWLLDQMLAQAGIVRRDCILTNVFNLRPAGNDVKTLCGNKGEAIPGLPALVKGKYVRREYAGELERLFNEVKQAQPNVVIALGATAAWAFLHSSGIKTIRGAVAPAAAPVEQRLGRPLKVLPTYHPAMVLRDFGARPVVVSDLGKAKRESLSPDLCRPLREIWTHPTLEDLHEYERTRLVGADLVAADIETAQDQITCIGFSPRPGSAIVIPFFRGANGHYWQTPGEEKEALAIVRRWLATYPTVFQNGMYDIHFLWRKYGIPVPKAAEDTMLLHHAWQPELEKGLGFLATIYTDELSWKFMRKGRRHD